jgi:hypothetical protein
MNCDDAFDALTDPRGRDAAALAAHLARCPRCRQMQQVLEPALSQLAEADRPAAAVDPLAPTDGDDEPRSVSTRPFLSGEALRIANAAALRLAKPAATCGQARRTGSGRLRVAFHTALSSAALILFGALGAWALSGGHRDFQPVPSAAPPPSRVCTRHEVARARSVDARAAILSCVSCHLSKDGAGAGPVPTSLRWPLPRARRASLLLAGDRPARSTFAMNALFSPASHC